MRLFDKLKATLSNDTNTNTTMMSGPVSPMATASSVTSVPMHTGMGPLSISGSYSYTGLPCPDTLSETEVLANKVDMLMKHVLHISVALERIEKRQLDACTKKKEQERDCSRNDCGAKTGGNDA